MFRTLDVSKINNLGDPELLTSEKADTLIIKIQKIKQDKPGILIFS